VDVELFHDARAVGLTVLGLIAGTFFWVQKVQ